MSMLTVAKRPNDPPLLATATARQSRFKAAMLASGFVQCNVWVPPGALPELKLQAEKLRELPHLHPGPLRDPVSGRLVSLR